MIEPVSRRNDAEVVAVAAQRPGAAQAYAAEHGIPRAFEGYQALIDDPDIDLVYIALPPSAHAEWSIAALEAGKHVLCEKPVAMNAAEARAIVETAERCGRIMMEAFHDLYHPLMEHVVELRTSDRLGAIRSVDARFQVNIPYEPDSIRHVPSLGGGAMMDLGCYPVHWLRTVVGEEPTITSAEGTSNPLGADVEMDAAMSFPGGAVGTMRVDMDTRPMLARIEIEAENGRVEVTNPVLPHIGHNIVTILDGVRRQYTIAGDTTYDYQLQAVIDAMASGQQPLTAGADSIANMAVIDAIYECAGYDRTA